MWSCFTIQSLWTTMWSYFKPPIKLGCAQQRKILSQVWKHKSCQCHQILTPSSSCKFLPTHPVPSSHSSVAPRGKFRTHCHPPVEGNELPTCVRSYTFQSTCARWLTYFRTTTTHYDFLPASRAMTTTTTSSFLLSAFIAAAPSRA